MRFHGGQSKDDSQDPNGTTHICDTGTGSEGRVGSTNTSNPPEGACPLPSDEGCWMRSSKSSILPEPERAMLTSHGSPPAQGKRFPWSTRGAWEVCRGCGQQGHSQDTGIAVLSGSNVQGRVPVDVHGMEVTSGSQQDLGYVHAA